MALARGDRLGPYEILAPVGAGGMGAVYRARDTRLGRDVAIKVSTEQFGERFEREARAVAQLNHPHICTLYDVGPNYLVMELVEGETLAARLKKGRLPLDQVTIYGAQIGEALAAAHTKGIVHRDLKPANIMITTAGVKVLDFGLAKSTQDDTITLTNAVMGTPAYMAPEQREGAACDPRTDIYALGLVLFEMSTGKRLPLGEKPVPSALPERLFHLIERCLASNPEDRWQSAKDLSAELQWAASTPVSTTPRGVGRNIWVAVAGVLVLVAAAALVISMKWLPGRSIPASDLSSQFTLSFKEGMDSDVEAGVDVMPAPSPDGRYLVFLANAEDGQRELWIRAIDWAEARPLPGTRGADRAFWSPDGRWIGFHADGKLKKISPSGGSPSTIAALPALIGAAWGSRGDILLRPSNRVPLFRISESGGVPLQVTTLDSSRTENSHRYQQFLPDGRRFLFTARCGQREYDALYLGSLDTGKVKRLMPIESNAQFVPAHGNRPDVIVYYREGALVARRIDLEREEVLGEPFPVFDGVAYQATGLGAMFRISDDGRLALLRPAGATESQLIWHERDGRQTGRLGPRGNYFQVRMSPDGTRLAYAGDDPQTGNRDIFVMEIPRGIISRITTNAANDWFPVWSPDGKQIVFGSDRDGGTQLPAFLKESIDGSAKEVRFTGTNPYDWSRDGRWLAFGELRELSISVAPAVPNGKPFVYLDTPFKESGPRFSPDGKWLAYVSNESGRFEVYVRPFTGGPAPAEGKVQISNGGGDFPVWNPLGGELYYLAADSSVYAVDSSTFGRAAPNPVRLFRACEGTRTRTPPAADQIYGYVFDTHDGKRFLVNCMAQSSGQFTLLINWPFGRARD